MMKLTLLAFQLLLVKLTIGIIQEPSLYKFCRHEYMETLGDMPVDERIKNDYCEQKIDIFVETEKEAKLMCRRATPFRVKEATHETDGTVTCKWESKTTCVENDDVLVFDRCFHLGQVRTASEANTGCKGKSSLHSVKSRDEAKFLSLLLSNEQPVHVSNSKQERPLDMTDRSGYVLNTRGFEESSSSSPDFFALSLLILDLENIPPGMLIEVAKDVQLRPLCSQPSVLYGNMEPSTTTIPEHLTDQQTVVNENLVIKSANVYQPQSSGKREVDVTNLHKTCQNICEDCFAVFPDMKDELAEVDAVTYVAGAHKSSPDLPKDNNSNDTDRDCVNDSAWNVNRGNFLTQSENGTTSGVEPSRFAANYPNNMCADGLNTALISMPNADLHDSPTITRHPIVCVKGRKPDEKPFSQCRQNSFETSNGGCKCKDGYTDIVNTTLAQKKDYVPGQLCTLDKPCTTNRLTIAFSFVMDFSVSLSAEDVIAETEFVKSAASIVPNNSYVQAVVFAGYVRHSPWLEPGTWTIQQFKDVVPQMVDRQFGKVQIGADTVLVGSSTNTQEALDKAKQNMEPLQVDRKVIILITDGVPTDREPALEAARQLPSANIKLLLVPVGNDLHLNLGFMKQMVVDPVKDIIDLTGDMKQSRNMFLNT